MIVKHVGYESYKRQWPRGRAARETARQAQGRVRGSLASRLAYLERGAQACGLPLFADDGTIIGVERATDYLLDHTSLVGYQMVVASPAAEERVAGNDWHRWTQGVVRPLAERRGLRLRYVYALHLDKLTRDGRPQPHVHIMLAGAGWGPTGRCYTLRVAWREDWPLLMRSAVAGLDGGRERERIQERTPERLVERDRAAAREREKVAPARLYEREIEEEWER